MQDISIVEESIELLPRIGRSFFASVSSLSAPAGLTTAQSRAVAMLYHGGDMTMTEIAAGLGIGMPSASELIDRLEERGMVSRSVDQADRRRVILALTDDALPFAVQIHDLHRAQVRRALAALEPVEHSIFLKSLRALAAAIDTGPAT
ncbi:MAG: MarR family winged helix-turn-helix transcriptional regulator [Thermomicrobiales bacterium]